jgi:hypothetical protein
METVLDILKYILPALIVLATAYLIIRYYMDMHYKSRVVELKKDNQRNILNIRLQAYERLTLLMERIHPSHLVVRMHQPGQSAQQLKSLLIHTIREEFEHNLSQQLYVSDKAWNMVTGAKEAVIRLINEASLQLKEDPTTTGFAKQVIEGYIQLDNDPIQKTKDLLKSEAGQLF